MTIVADYRLLLQLAQFLLLLGILGVLLSQRGRARRTVVALEFRYRKLLNECVRRQPDHEREHQEAHGGEFTPALRIENVARRFERKIHAAGLPALSLEERRSRAREALWQPR